MLRSERHVEPFRWKLEDPIHHAAFSPDQAGGVVFVLDQGGAMVDEVN